MIARSLAIAAALALGLVAAPASACLNDGDTEATERLFCSQYPLPGPKPDSSEGESTPGGILLTRGLLNSAAGLGLAALGITLAAPSILRRRG